VTPIESYEQICDETHMPKPRLAPQNTRPWAEALEKLLTDREAWETESSRSREAARGLERYLSSLQRRETEVAVKAPTPLDRLSPEKRALLMRRLRKVH
jgi:hypothetical protein